MMHARFSVRGRVLGLLALVLGLFLTVIAWAVSSPVGAVPDEFDHIVHAYGTATGQTLPGLVHEETIEGRTFTMVRYPAALEDFPSPECYQFDSTATPCAAESHGQGMVSGTSGMTRYPIAYYIPVGAVLWLGTAAGLGGPVTLVLARIVSGLLSVLVLALAAVVLGRRFDRRPIAVAMALCMVPMTWFLFASINPNGLEISAAMLLAAVVCCLRHDAMAGTRLGRDVLWLFPIAILVLGMTRPLSAIWACGLCLLVLVPVQRATGDAGRRVPLLMGPRWWAVLDVLLALSTVAWLAWTSSVRGGEAGEDRMGAWSALPFVTRIVAVLQQWASLVFNGFGHLGWLDTPMPLALFVLWVVAAAWVFGRMSLGRVRPAVGLGLVGAYGLLMTTAIFLESYLSAFAWQGRYYLPVLAAMAVLCVPALQGRMLESRQLRRATALVVVAGACATLIALVWSTWRYVYGFHTPMTRFDAMPYPWRAPQWAPVIGTVGVFLTGGLGLVLAAASSIVPWSRASARPVPDSRRAASFPRPRPARSAAPTAHGRHRRP